MLLILSIGEISTKIDFLQRVTITTADEASEKLGKPQWEKIESLFKKWKKEIDAQYL